MSQQSQSKACASPEWSGDVHSRDIEFPQDPLRGWCVSRQDGDTNRKSVVVGQRVEGCLQLGVLASWAGEVRKRAAGDQTPEDSDGEAGKLGPYFARTVQDIKVPGAPLHSACNRSAHSKHGVVVEARGRGRDLAQQWLFQGSCWTLSGDRKVATQLRRINSSWTRGGVVGSMKPLSF